MTDEAANATNDSERIDFQRLIQVGIALSAEHDHNRLMETILLEAKDLTNADGGTLYLRTEDDRLKFEIMRTDSLNIAMGGTTGKTIAFPALRMYDNEGEPNHRNVASHVALTGETQNIPDAYEAEGFDFTGAKNFDKASNYRSKSFLTVPLKDHHENVIGVLQLINARDKKTDEVISFSGEIQPVIESLSSQAAVALDNQRLLEAQKQLLDSFIKLIAAAIDAKSPYTGGHCQRVPELAMMLGNAAMGSDDPVFADFHMTEDQQYELNIAALLHDCGKVTTPEYVVDKATKLETIYNRIHEVRTRFEVVKRDVEIEYLNAMLEGKGDPDELKAARDEKLAQLDDDFAFVAECNIGGEFMADDKVERVKRIADVTWTRTLDNRVGLSQEEMDRCERTEARPVPCEENLLFDRPDHIIEKDSGLETTNWDKFGFKMDIPKVKFNQGEIYNLCIPRGTLTAEERFKINDHIVQTIIMLDNLPFPKHLEKVPEYAGAHHETMIGTGYPRKLERDDMSLPARIMAIADIFEALTAADRPYKPAKTLSESVKIMSFMVKDQHIDPDLFKLFLSSGVFQEYADRFLLPTQLDEVDTDQYLKKKD